MSAPAFVSRWVSRPAIVCVVVLVVLVGAFPFAAASQAVLTPPHADTGVDYDLDTLFDALQIQINLDATVGGGFFIGVNLFDATDTFFITGNSTFTVLTGPSSVFIDLSGIDIRNAGIDGPYHAAIEVYDDTFTLDDSGVHVTGAYLATDFDTVPGTLAPPHADAGIDADADLLFDILRVTVNVTATQAATFQVTAVLFDQFFTYIDDTSRVVSLAPGPDQPVALDLAGWRVRANAIDGPYFVDLTLSDAIGLVTYDTGAHLTAAYGYLEFDLPPAALAPPHSDRGVDADGDMLFDVLQVNVSLQVDLAGTYQIDASLWDSTLTTLLGFAFNSSTFAMGPGVISLDFRTDPIVANGVDGPYAVIISLYTDTGEFIEQGNYVTAAYTISQFDPLAASFAPPHSDQGVDRDVPADGEYNVLEVDVSINVNESGVFMLDAQLWDSGSTTLIASEFLWVGLPVGQNTVPVNFSGVLIRNSGIGGPYLVDLTLSQGFFGFLDTDQHLTAAYVATQFQNEAPVSLIGTVRDGVTTAPLPFARVEAYNYTNSLAFVGSADGSGAYNLTLFQGDWIVTYDEMAYDAQLVRMSLTVPATRDADLFPGGPLTVVVNGTLGPWQSLDVAETTTAGEDMATARLQLDWTFGNRDQYFTQAEFDILLTFFGGPPIAPPNSTWDFFLTDGIWYDYVAGSFMFTFLDVPGPIDSSVPFRSWSRFSTANATIPSAGTHTVDLFVDYDDPGTAFSYNLALPAGFLLQSYTAPPEVTVTGVGTGVARADPAQDPDPFDLITGTWIQLVAFLPDGVPPAVTSVSAAPDPVPVGSPVTIDATATDNTAVDTVRLEVWDPVGTLVLNATMTNVAPDTYRQTYMPVTWGTFTFTATATDAAGNTAAGSGQFVAIELTPPSVTGAQASPDPSELGTPVLLSATVTDNDAVATVRIEIRDAGGVPVANASMAYNAGTGDYEVARTMSSAQTYGFTIWATDPSGNVGSATGSFVVQDTTPPQLVGVSATPDPVELGATVTIAVTASDLAVISSVTVEVRDPANVIVGTFPMALVGSSYQYTYDPLLLGTYAFTITATDGSGNPATTTGTFVSQDTTNPEANAGPDQVVDAGVAVTFDGSSSVDNDAVVNYTWTFTEDGQTRTLYGIAPTHAFTAAGTYVVTLRATDASDNFGEDTVTITVQSVGGGVGGIPSWAFLVLAVVVAIIVAVLLLIRRRKAASAPPPAPPAPAVPPSEMPTAPTAPEEPASPSRPFEEPPLP